MSAELQNDGIELSIIIPMYNESLNATTLFDRMLPVCRNLGGTWEIVCVDDGSKDDTTAIVAARRETAPEIVLVRFARNFGQHAAVTAGFAHARGKYLITIDADLQNPPEEIPKLLAEMREGHDLVNTVRANRQDTWFRRTASRWTNRLVRALSGIRLNDFGCMLRGYSRDVAQAVVRCRERRTFIPALASLFAGNPCEISVAHAERSAGESKYPFHKLLSLQLDLITNFSVAPLRLLFVVGLLMGVLGVGLGATLLIGRFVLGESWANNGTLTVLGLLLFFIGGQFFALGLVGEYVGRVLIQVRARDPWVVRDVLGGEGQQVETAETKASAEAKAQTPA
jgi:undecaprenyl-phosphate 4-deoxy-4-formamido-L-arabinose transferase